MAKLCNNALTVSNLRNIVEVFSMAEKLGISLAGLRDAFDHSSGGSFILQALGTKVTAGNAAHIAELNRTDVDEFAAAMRRKGLIRRRSWNGRSKAPTDWRRWSSVCSKRSWPESGTSDRFA
jgi:3-hydroxyisobutyrate dehydrogenase-like beta-hydroxyacid dehydrogenase